MNRDSYPQIYKERHQWAGLLLIFIAQAWSAVSLYPYYYTYRNPILYAAGWYANFPQKPYGEGLEQAGEYLSSLPNAKDSTALVYYARGCFSFFYAGETLRFKPYYVEDGHERELLSEIRSSDYIVVYYAVQGQLNKYDIFLKILRPVKPLHEIWMDGYKYAVIYEVKSIPPAVLEEFAK